MGFRQQLETIRKRDPAFKSALEMVLYPSFWAIGFHRIGHWLYNRKRYVLARLISQLSRSFTGIEIHPGARIGQGLFIDHGMGVVIGETCEIGDDVLIYQGATLGGTGKDVGKRHPTIGNNVMIGSGVKILGPFKVGDNSRIGAGSVVLREVPSDSTVVGVPARIVNRRGRHEANSLDQIQFPDPLRMEIYRLRTQIGELEKRLTDMEGALRWASRSKGAKSERIAGMRIYNTMSRKKESFVPLVDNMASVYVCGPTVYDYMHVGNARPLITFDAVRRYLIHKGYKVNYVQNFTDIDDKIINKANENGRTVEEVATQFIEESLHDMKGLNCLLPTSMPRVTQEMDEIKAMIKALVDKGYAYVSEGSVFFNTGRFERYGCLSGKNQDELIAGARVEANDSKRSQTDFVLWKPAKPGEPKWGSPWSEGRPGWHIECSVMAKKYLGDTFDIHAGGEDLIFPHHENEIAQSEAANGKTFARYWMHVRHVMLNGSKMSKSEGNYLTIREAAQKYSYSAIRFFVLSAHYRSPINFSPELLESAKSGLERIRNCVVRLKNAISSAKQFELGEGEAEQIYKIQEHVKRFEESMEDDFNTADAISAVFELVRHANLSVKPETSKKAAEALLEGVESLCGILGIELEEAKDESRESEISELVAKRQEARKAKDYKTADAIRAQLSELGVVLQDSPDGVRWSYQ
jgi:cysteinyl-tRNA synthetase